MKTISTSVPHNLTEGAILEVKAAGETRWSRFTALLRRPRIVVVHRVIDACTFETAERRMSWAQWRRAIRNEVLG